MHHFLKETDFSIEQAQNVFSKALEFKLVRLDHTQPLEKKSWGLLFYKRSTRTRISFEVGINELGGFPLILNSENTQIGRGEAVEDSAKVMSRYLHGLVIRTFEHEIVEKFARHSNMPVINGLTDYNHPCQILSDILTVWEHRKNIKDLKIVYLGDGNNIVHSWLQLACRLPMHFVCCNPSGFDPDKKNCRDG